MKQRRFNVDSASLTLNRRFSTFCAHWDTFYIGLLPKEGTLANREDQDKMLQKATSHYETYPFKYTENFTTKENENFQIKDSGIFHISAQNIDCGYSLEPPRRGGSNEYPQSFFLNRNKKNNVYPCKPQFYCIKLGSKSYRRVFVM